MANQWFKFYGGEYLSDPKIERLSPVERSCWITLLCLASMNGDGDIEYLTVEVLLNKSGVQYDPYHPEEWERGLGVLNKFQKMRMIDVGNEIIKIINWEKRQETSLTDAERAKKYRESKKKQHNKAICHEIVTERPTIVTLEENRIEENRREKKRIIKKEEDKYCELSSQINEIFNIFYKINPTINWGNKTSRSSAEIMIKKFGFEEVKRMAEQVISVQGQEYCPVATTPHQMKEKLAHFKIFFDKNNTSKFVEL